MSESDESPSSFEYDAEYDEEDFDYGQDDQDFDYGETVNNAQEKKAYETAFIVLSLEDRLTRQKAMIDHLSSVLGLEQEKCELLLRVFKWHEDLLIERYIEDSETVLKGAGISDSSTTDTHSVTDSRRASAGGAAGSNSNSGLTSGRPYAAQPAPHQFTCLICCEEWSRKMQVFSLSCGHLVCTKCYSRYVSSKIHDGEIRAIRCPGSSECHLVLPSPAVKALVSTDDYDKYLALLDQLYVQDSETLVYCPAPDCNFAVECQIRQEELSSVVPSVQCRCGQNFCFGCGLDDHQPATCILVRKWLKKCQDDSETSTWISANTKECPKCSATIEKNGGCNHMTCKKCRFEFCWICMGDWGQHGTSYYNCSRYNDESSMKARDEQEKSRYQLLRYLHYYNRYANHLQSLRLDKETYVAMEHKMRQLQETKGMSWIEAQFMSQAFDVLQKSRKTLTWTYAFAFYLQKGNMTSIFEDNQKDLEMAVEQLSELFEKPVAELAKKKIQLLDKCAYVSQRRLILLEDAAQGLKEGIWNYNE